MKKVSNSAISMLEDWNLTFLLLTKPSDVPSQTCVLLMVPRPVVSQFDGHRAKWNVQLIFLNLTHILPRVLKQIIQILKEGDLFWTRRMSWDIQRVTQEIKLESLDNEYMYRLRGLNRKYKRLIDYHWLIDWLIDFRWPVLQLYSGRKHHQLKEKGKDVGRILLTATRKGVIIDLVI